MKKYFVIVLLFLLSLIRVEAQRAVVDSLQNLLLQTKEDTVKIKLLNQIAKACSIYNPDSALFISRKVLALSRQLKFLEGEKRALRELANAYIKLGDYPQALQMHLQTLQIAEKEKNNNALAKAYINIGSVYVYQEQYREGLPYYLRADSIIQLIRDTSLRYYSTLNIGDLYDRLKIVDSAFSYFNQSLNIAFILGNEDFIGTSKIGLGHTYVKMDSFSRALQNYRDAIPLLEKANDEDMICEATLGLARLFEKENKMDSAGYYARYSYFLAKKDGFQSRQLDAAQFLTNHYKQIKNVDSAFVYINESQILKDSIESKEKIRQLQILSTNEKIRQAEMEEAKIKAAKERKQQLQLLFIGIFIPGIFLFTLLLSRIRIPVRAIKLMGILSLLILFEYLTLLLHPRVLELTNHTPIFEIMIFVAIAAVLIPGHHRIEHWLIERLTQHHQHASFKNIRLNTKKIKIKKPSE
jgi:tetratricopeptide (TPR) repeat protein